MNIIAVDDKKPIVTDIITKLQTIAENSDIKGFTDPFSALDYAKKTAIDLAFLDIEMPLMNGLILAQRLKEISPTTLIVFLTGFSEYALDAYGLHAAGYLVKPIEGEKLRLEIQHIKTLLPKEEGNRVKIQTFGGFDVFVDGKALLFTRAKSKELLAILVDMNGASATMKELCAIIWEDKPHTTSLKSYFHSVLSSLISTLATNGTENIVVKKRNSFAIDTTAFDCDYYDFLQGKAGTKELFRASYLPQYSWAEGRVGGVDDVE